MNFFLLISGYNFFKFGRAFWNVGVLNPQHAHADDFADRPLPYRVFLNKAYNDDGLEASYLFGSSEIGFGIFRGEDFPFGNTAASEGTGSDAWSAFYKSTLNLSTFPLCISRLRVAEYI